MTSTGGTRESALGAKHPAAEALDVLVAKYRLRIEEWDFSQLDSDLGDRIMTIHDSRDGARTIAVAQEQDPWVRLHAVRRLLIEMGERP
ncbi:hypothetical protein ACFU9Y_10685 [Streptomyces sp. NPDC057621]|uniref:hypothetical protein n=1 Tax=Streptomyces sp. NPDC057621 TaxID=3346186 RepID=UPI00368EF18D